MAKGVLILGNLNAPLNYHNLPSSSRYTICLVSPSSLTLQSQDVLYRLLDDNMRNLYGFIVHVMAFLPVDLIKLDSQIQASLTQRYPKRKKCSTQRRDSYWLLEERQVVQVIKDLPENGNLTFKNMNCWGSVNSGLTWRKHSLISLQRWCIGKSLPPYVFRRS